MTHAIPHTTTVTLVSCTGILGETLRHTLTRTSGVTVVADVPFDGITSLSNTISRVRSDAVVWLMDHDTTLTDHPELFGADRGCAVIAVLDDGRRGAAWQLRPYRTDLHSPSLETLVDALRAVPTRS